MTVEDGYVPTPPAVADYMAAELFIESPSEGDRILYPGAGTGCLASAVHRYCSVRDQPCPEGVAVDTNSERLETFDEHVASSEPTVPPISTRSERRLQATYPRTIPSADAAVAMDIETVEADFLLDPPDGAFDYIIANPPYTRYSELDDEKRDRYREKFRSAEGQFPLFIPFVEQMQQLLADDGHLVFLAPVNYLMGTYASAFREELRRDTLQMFMVLPENVFRHWKVETVVTTLKKDPSLGRDGHFWLESFVWKSRVRELLRDVGITDEERQNEAVKQYYKNYEEADRLLNLRQKSYGEDGGYNMDRIPPEYRPGDSHQGDLGRWSP